MHKPAMITSVRNANIQWVRRLQTQARLRREDRVFVLEGVRLVEEAFQAGWVARLVLHAPGLSRRGQALAAQFTARGTVVEAVSDSVLAAVSDTDTPQGILAVMVCQELALPAALDFLLVLDGLRDPGNLGTLLRTAAAAGVQAVLATPGTVDPFAPKVLRAAMGAHFRLPLRSLDWLAIQSLLPAGMHVFLADSGGGQVFTACDFRPPLALVVGGEAAGAGSEAASLVATRQDASRVHIPMVAQVESLNAAVAGAVLLFEVARQRSM